MSASADIEAFIAEELAEMAPLFQDRLSEQLRQRGIIASGDLLRSMAAKAVAHREIQVAFMLHGRFHDMGARAGWRKGVYIGKGDAARRPKPKPSKFYSRTKMGLFGQLVSNLSNKYVEALYQQARSELAHGRQD
jgi:hypothetical protein